MNQNNHGHGQPRRNSTSFNRHGGNHSGRPNHQHGGHQRWQNRYAKDYGREFDANFGHGDCSVGNSASPKEPNYLPHGHGYPKPSQLSPVVNRNNHVSYSNEASGIQDWRHISHTQAPVDRRHLAGPGGSQQERRHTMANSFQHSGDRRHANGLLDRRHISPPLHINVCDNSPSLLATNVQSEHHHNSQQRRHARDMRVSPVHLQHSPPFYRQTSDESIKSESPSRKRRRLSRSGHHQILEHPSQPPSPPRRSPRQHPPVVHSMQGSPPLRRARYRDRDFNHGGHHPAFLPSPPPGPTHPHQSTVMMDINQIPVTIPMNHEPIWNYSPGPHISLCSAPPGAPPHLHTCHVHNLYQPQFSQNCLQVPAQFPNCLPPHHHHQPPYGGLPSALPVTGQYHGPHQHLQPQRADALELDLLGDHHSAHSALHGASSLHVPPLQVSPPTPLFLPAEPRASQLDLLHARARRRPPPTRTRWHHNLPPLPAPPQYSGFLLHFLAMFSNPPMSPFSQTELSSSDSTETENYEALLNLAERLGEAKPRGLAKLEIEQLVSYKFNADTHQGDQTSCVVCMCDFEARQLLRVLPCSHEFHAKCVDKWLRSNRTCPICRGNASEYFNNSD